ncbi:uncharacterized protein [Dermacentor andersoni]|uniref:uncharacterized protein isoform X2 n=1 Tax=Dermacentor andersoni TaxID=34620 RepID=UPI00241711F4|nr:uncharacterized protein LOC126533086 isoform X2 [Dermacentor andersoni]
MAALGLSRSPEGDGVEETMAVPISEKDEHESDDASGGWILLEDVAEVAGEAALQRRRRGEAADDVSTGDRKQQRPGAPEERHTFDVIVRGGYCDLSRNKLGPENDLWVVDLDLAVCVPMVVVAVVAAAYIVSELLERFNTTARLLVGVTDGDCSTCASSDGGPIPASCTAVPFKKLIADESYVRIFLRLYDVLATPGYNELIEKAQQMGLLHCPKCVVVLYATFTCTVTIALVLALLVVVLQAKSASAKVTSTWNICWQRHRSKGLVRFCREMPRLLSRCLLD